MIKIKEVAFFVYAVTDIKKSRAFYEGILGLKPGADFPVSDDSKWIEYDINGVTLAIGQSEQWLPSSDGATAGLEVEDFAAAVAHLKENGVQFSLEASDFPSCSMAVVFDPDKNKVCIHKRK